ncbi:MAG TPA: DUF2085 domain-containing protein [Anaerolineae bacterium]|nr:DUF2085 domain-containing protein [Anaerolineae bacterium]
MTTTSTQPVIEDTAVSVGGFSAWISRHWLFLILLVVLLWVGLPWLAPVFMALGWTKAGEAIYLLYSAQCHQLPQRSFFIFGNKSMYSLSEVQAAWQDTTNPLILRQFVGNPEMGWKVAWSDRMVSMYSSIVLFGVILFLPLRKRLKPLPVGIFLLLLLPMAIDGGSHFVSDLLAPIGSGFRDSNLWLVNLTNNAFPATFYAGDALGSFNSWMRLITGILFGLAIVWFLFPHIRDGFTPDNKHKTPDERTYPSSSSR